MGATRRTGYEGYSSQGAPVKVIDFSSVTATESSLANATGHALTMTSNAARCTWTSATNGQRMGLKYQKPSGTWDFSDKTPGVEVSFVSGVSWSAFKVYAQIYMCLDSGSTFTNYFASGTMTTSFQKFSNTRYMLVPNAGWTANGTAATDPSAWSKIVRIEVHFFCNNALNTPWAETVDTFAIYQCARARPKVIIAFDDEFASVLTEGYSNANRMQSYGFPGTLFVDSYKVGKTISGSTYMTWANIQTLANAGWTVASHGYGHAPLALTLGLSSGGTTTCTATVLQGGQTVPACQNVPAKTVGHGLTAGVSFAKIIGAYEPEYNGTFLVASTPDSNTFTYTMTGVPQNNSGSNTATGPTITMEWLTTAEIFAYLQQCQLDIVANVTGSSVHPEYFAYANGAYSPTTQSVASSLGITYARTSNSGGWPSGSIIPTSQNRALSLVSSIAASFTSSSADTGAKLLAFVDGAIRDGGGSIVTYFHNLTATPSASTDFSTTEWQTFLDGLRTRQRQGLIDVVSLDTWYKGLVKGRGQ